MRNYQNVLMLTLVALILVSVGVSLSWKTVYFHYLMAVLTRTEDGAIIADIQERIEEISPQFVPQLREIFFDPNEDFRKRHASIYGLTAGNPTIAREAFQVGIQTQDNILILESIWGFSLLKDESAIDQILPFASSESEIIRQATADYLNSVLLPQSIPALERLSNDTSKYIQYLAKDSLMKIQAGQR